MTMEVIFYVGWTTWQKTYEVKERESARRIVESRNQTPKIIAMNLVF